MKLRLPQALLAALLVAATTSQAVTVTSNANQSGRGTFAAGSAFNADGINYTVANGTGTVAASSLGAGADNNFVATVNFTLNLNAINTKYGTNGTATGYEKVIWLTNTDDANSWGIDVGKGALGNVSGTGADVVSLVGDWNGLAWTNGSNGKYVITSLLSADAGAVMQLQAVLSDKNPGTTLNKVADNGNTTRLFQAGSLFTSANSVNSIKVSTTMVSDVSYNYQAQDVSNADGTWTKTYTTFRKIATDSDLSTAGTWGTTVAGTLVTGGRLAVNNSGASDMSKAGEVVVGGSGQLFLNTWQTSGGGAISLSNDIFLGASDYAGTRGDDGSAQMGVLRVGLDSGNVSLTGAVTLIEDSSIYVAGSSSNSLSIGTLNVGGYTLDKMGDSKLYISNYSQAANAGGIHVKGGMVMMDSHTVQNVNNVTLDAGTTFAVRTSIGGANGSDADALTIGTLTLNGDATLRTCDNSSHRSRILLSNINSTVNGDVVLSLYDDHPATGNASAVVFKNGITGTMQGRLDLTEDKIGTREFAVILADNDALVNTSVNVAKIANNGRVIIAVGSNETSEVQIKGLSSNATGASGAFGTSTVQKAISYTGAETGGISNTTASQGGHTLIITADGEDAFTFNGDLGNTLNVKMTGTGSQTLKNVGANAMADAGAGHLTISNAVGNNTTLKVGVGQLTVNGTLGTGVTLVSDYGWSLNAASNKYEYSLGDYDIADHVDGTNASTLLDSASYAFVASGNGENSACSTLDATDFHHDTLILQSDTTPGTTASGAYVNAGSTWGSDVQKLVMDGANLISLSGQTNTISKSIELKGNTAFRAYGDPASGGDSRAHATMILTGELSGTGNIIQRDGGTLVLNFSDSSGWTGGLVTQNSGNNAGVLEIESSMRASSVTLNAGSVLRIGKANTGVTLNTGAFTTTEATQNIELGNGAAWNINGRMTLNNNVATTVNIGTIGSSFNGTTRDGDYGSVTVTGLTMAINDNKHSTLNIGANVALNITGEGSTNINANNDAYATAPLYLSNWQSNSITNIYGTLNALNCQYISVVVPGNSSNTMEMNVMEGGVLNMKGLILQYRQNTGTDQAYAHVKLKDGSMLNIGSEGIQKYAIGGGGARQDVCKLYIHMGEGVTIGNLNGADGWTAGYDFTGDASFNNTTINTQNYVAKTDGSAGAVDATDTTGGTITLTGNVNGSVTKAGAGKLVVSAGTTGDDTLTATVEKGTLEIGAAATVAAGGKTTVASGATLDVQGALTLHTELANSGTVTATGSNATIAFANDTLLSGNGDTTFGSAQSGSATVTKRGTGQLTLTDGIGAGNTLLFEAGTLSGGMTSGTLSFASLVGQDNLSLTSIAVGGSKLTLSDVGIDLGSLDLTDEAAGTFNLITYTDASKFQLGSNMLVNGNSVDGNGWFYITDGTGAAIGKAQLVATETALQLIVDHSVEINTLVWGTQNGTWVGAGHVGWQDDATYTDGSVVIFSGEGTAANAPLTVALSGDIAPSTIQVSGYYTFQSDTTTAGHLAGIAKLTVGSVNTSEVDGEEVTTPVATVLTLATDNSDWTGDATIMDGAELIATNTNALGTAQIAIEQGGTLTLSSAEGETGIFDLTQTVSGAGALQVKDYAHVKLGNASITGLTTVSDHAHVEANVAGALGDVTLKDSAVLTLGDDAAVGGTINFSTGGTLKYADGVTADFSGSITGDTVTVDVGSNTVTWAKTPGTTLVSGSADTTGTLILDNRETQPVDELVVAGGKVKIGHAKALKNTTISNGTANINTISTNITLNGGTLEFTNGYQTDGNGLAASVLARWTYMISGTVTADLASGQSAHITMGTETGYNNGDGIGFANENALTYLATNNGGTLYIDADITGFGSINAVNRKFNIAKSTGAVDGAEVVINGQLGNNGNNNTDSSRIIIDKLGAGTLKIAGANHTPQLKIEEGTVIAAHADALGRSRNEAQKVIVGTGEATATLDIQADCSTVLLEGNSNGVITNSTDTMHLLVIGEQSANTRASRFEGSITGKLGIRMINGSAGGIRNKLTLTGENTYTGATTLWNNAGIYLDGGSIGTASGSNEVDVYEGAEFQISNGGYVQNTGAKITNVQGQTADMQAVALTASGIDLKKSEGNDRAQGAIRNAYISVSATGNGGKYTVDNVGLTSSTVTVAGGKTLAIGDNVSASGLSISTASGATEAAKLTADSTGHIAIASDSTLKVTDMEISNIAFATETGRGTLDITAGAMMAGHCVEAAGEGNVPTSTTALMSECTLQNTDVVISAVGATEAAASGEDFGSAYVLNLLSRVQLDENSTLTLIGMENYTNVTLHWSLADVTQGAGEPSLLADAAPLTRATGLVYEGGSVNLATLTGASHGQVVDVWVSYNAPEPTTGTLSMLALAALAARRRRKG